MKFGGAAVESPECYSSIADLIIERSKTYPQLVIVVSAMGDMTNQLGSLAYRVHPNPPRREYDMLVRLDPTLEKELDEIKSDIESKLY